MKRVLVKYKLLDNHLKDSCIKSVFCDNPVQILQILKEVEDIKIEDDYYTYAMSEFVPALSDEFLDVVYVYLDKVGYDDEDLGWLN